MNVSLRDLARANPSIDDKPGLSKLSNARRDTGNTPI
jgi:hypothetical protein